MFYRRRSSSGPHGASGGGAGRRWVRFSYAILFGAFVSLCLVAYLRSSDDAHRQVPSPPERTDSPSSDARSTDGPDASPSGSGLPRSSAALPDDDGTPAGRLVSAAANGDTERLRSALAEGVAPAERNGNGRGALHVAAANDETLAIQILIEAGAEVDAPDGIGWSPLAWATYYGSLSAVEALLEAGADPNARYEPNLVTALEQLMAGWHMASVDGSTPLRASDRGVIGEKLFAAGADPNLSGPYGPPLRMALDFHRNTRLLALFFEHGARVDELPDLRRLAERQDDVGDLFREAFREADLRAGRGPS